MFGIFSTLTRGGGVGVVLGTSRSQQPQSFTFQQGLSLEDRCFTPGSLCNPQPYESLQPWASPQP